MLLKRKIEFIHLILFVFLVFPAHAAIDLSMKGSVYSEIRLLPDNNFEAGQQIRLYSELIGNGDSSIYARLWFFNQKAGELSRFDSISHLSAINLIDWVELNLNTKLGILAIGNYELNYSPYTISLRDNALNDYWNSNNDYRGIALKGFNLLGFSGDGFILWGLEKNSSKNLSGISLRKDFLNTKIETIIYNFSDKTEETIKKVREVSKGKLVEMPNELIWEQLVSLGFEQNLGKFGSLSYLIAAQEQVENNYSFDVLKEAKIEIPLTEVEKVVLGYRDIPSNYNPLLRDRTPEFDSNTGYYLGFNPVDRYRNKVGFYASVEINQPTLTAKLFLSNMKEHKKMPNRYLVKELSIFKKNNHWEYDFFSKLKEIQRLSNTQISDAFLNKFCRFIIRKRYPLKSLYLIPGAEFRYQDNFNFRYQDNFNIDNKTLSLFFQCEQECFLAEVGLKKKLTGKTLEGYWFGLKYLAPNGLSFHYRYTFTPDGSSYNLPPDGKIYYDPDYRVLEPDNIFQISVDIKF
ncbi:MAG: hypothetical protein GX076_00925 [Clostridiales bacterium]|nr:hypothetical protein [Clostridiales bacterium]